jgi:hypothetical protein
VDEIRGVVTNRANSTDNIFDVGLQVVNATGATVLPAGASFANGSVVEVLHGPARVSFGQFRILVEARREIGLSAGTNSASKLKGWSPDSSGIQAASSSRVYQSRLPAPPYLKAACQPIWPTT